MSFLRLLDLALGKASDALGETVFSDEFGAAYPILRFGGERGVTTLVEIQADDLGKTIATHVQTFAILQALEESELLFVQLE